MAESGTPRTNSHAYIVNGISSVSADFARELERDLAAAQATLAERANNLELERRMWRVSQLDWEKNRDRLAAELSALNAAAFCHLNHCAYSDLAAECAKLQAFKDYTHQRLDEAGIPHSNPDSPHTAAGCRIGGRLDQVFAECAQYKRDAERLLSMLDAAGIEIVKDALAQESHGCKHVAPRTRVFVFPGENTPAETRIYCSACGADIAAQEQRK